MYFLPRIRTPNSLTVFELGGLLPGNKISRTAADLLVKTGAEAELPRLGQGKPRGQGLIVRHSDNSNKGIWGIWVFHGRYRDPFL